jgi:hypothetical protein
MKNAQEIIRVTKMLERINCKERFSATISKFFTDFILAEETLLIKMGWDLESVHGTYSTWSIQKFTKEGKTSMFDNNGADKMIYSRNQAILIEKSTNSNLGLY